MKYLIIILLFLPALLSAQPYKFSDFNLKNNFPGTWKLAGYIDTLPLVSTPQGFVPTKINKQYDAGILINRANHTGTQPATSIFDFNAAANTALAPALAGKQATGDYATNSALTSGLSTKQPVGDYATNSALSSGLAGKQSTLVSGSTIKTINGIPILGSGDIPISGPGGGIDTASSAYKHWVAKTAQDSAQTQTLPFSPKTFETDNGRVYIKGERFTPTVQKGGAIVGTVTFEAGSTDLAGVMVVTITGSSDVGNGVDIGVVSFGGSYSRAPSVIPSTEQFFPRIIIKNRSALGFTIASGEQGGTMQPGIFKFPYQTMPL